ncbi:MAG: PQQ-binding-like beta-propeller repeat protein [Bdellovibrionales bacterium]|nr:PQQ-binding-like beta-propeller repeat protein [Bdellovibrionales bacterium]
MTPFRKNYGVFLSLSFVASAIYFLEIGLYSAHSPFLLLKSTPWPIPIINTFNLSPFLAMSTAWLLLLVSAASSLAFLTEKKYSSILLWASLFLKLGVYFSDYRLMGNFHLMQHWTTVLFLVIPYTIHHLRLFFCLFYFFAGLLKLNKDWVSGLSLFGPGLPISEEVRSALLIGVIILEIGLIWGLLLPSRKVALGVFAILVVFHLCSTFYIQLYYPTIMLLLLTFIPLGLIYEKWTDIHIKDFLNFRFGILVSIFLISQLNPYLSAGDTAITGEGRLTALNMIDIKPHCVAPLIYQEGENSWQEVDLAQNHRAVRVTCDPAYFVSQIQDFCSKNPSQKALFGLLTRRPSQSEYQPVFWMTEACQQAFKYSVWGRNSFVVPQTSTKYVFKSTESFDTSPAGDSSSFRGDLQNTGLLKISFSEKSSPTVIPLSMKVNIGIHNAAKSSPVADDLGFYVAGDSGVFNAIDPTGHLRWSLKFDSPRGIHSSPAIYKGFIFIGTYSGRLYKIHRQTGHISWWVQLGDAIGATPKVVDSSIYVNVETENPANGFVVKLNADDGSQLWKGPLHQQQSHSTPAISEDKAIIIYGSNQGTLTALRTDNGRLIWQKKLGAEIKTSPLIFEKHVFVGSWSENLFKFDITDGKMRGVVHLGAMIMSSPLIIPHRREILLGSTDGNLNWIHIDKMTLLQSLPLGEKGHKASAIAFRNKKGFRILVPCRFDSLCLFDDQRKIMASEPVGGKMTNEPALGSQHMLVSPEFPASVQLLPVPQN